MPTECICMSMILLLKCCHLDHPLSQVNQAAEHLISRLPITNLEIAKLEIATRHRLRTQVMDSDQERDAAKTQIVPDEESCGEQYPKGSVRGRVFLDVTRSGSPSWARRRPRARLEGYTPALQRRSKFRWRRAARR